MKSFYKGLYVSLRFFTLSDTVCLRYPSIQLNMNYTVLYTLLLSILQTYVKIPVIALGNNWRMP